MFYCCNEDSVMKHRKMNSVCILKFLHSSGIHQFHWMEDHRIFFLHEVSCGHVNFKKTRRLKRSTKNQERRQSVVG